MYDKNKIYDTLYKLSKRGAKHNEVPVACLILHKNKIVAKNYNKRHKTKDPTNHAEIICIRKATQKMKRCFLDDCEMYTTLEPCEMCKAVIRETRIKKVFYILSKKKYTNINTDYVKLSISNANKYEKILSNFFKNKR